MNFGHNTIVHTGTIVTSGEHSAGIEAFDGFNTIHVARSASIMTQAKDADAIFADTGNIEIILDGTIITDGDESRGIELEGSNNTVVVNSGASIFMHGGTTRAIYFLGPE